MIPAHTFRTLTADQVETALEWAAREGWNPGLDDADAFRAEDVAAFGGLFLDDELAVTISATRYAGGFAFIGFFICRPDLRGRGLGHALWRHTLAERGGLLGLDGVVAQQENYARSGFVLAHRNIRYGGTAEGSADPRVSDLAPAHLAGVAALDHACFGFARPAFLKAWLAPPRGRACVLVADGRLRGYGVVRQCRDGFKIGPLFADDAATAEALFRTLALTAAGGPVFLDVPEPNAAARVLAESAGLAPVFETARMYRGPAPDLPLHRIFGITTFELG